jgi:hypothetical protein
MRRANPLVVALCLFVCAATCAARTCGPGSCGKPKCAECCHHKDRCCGAATQGPCPPPTPPAPPGPPSPHPTAQCLLPEANDNRCCKPGAKDGSFNRPCDDPTFAANHSFCNVSLGVAARLEDIISRMSTEEKSKNLGSASAIPSSQLSLYNFWSEGTHGVASGGSVARSQFAMPITTAQSFNRSLWKATGAQIVRGTVPRQTNGRATKLVVLTFRTRTSRRTCSQQPAASSRQPAASSQQQVPYYLSSRPMSGMMVLSACRDVKAWH